MSVLRRLLIVALAAGAVTTAVVLAAGGEAAGGRARPTHPSAFFDERAFAHALARASSTPRRPIAGARAVIVPHHWLAGDLIVSGLRNAAAGRTAAGGTVRRVVLIGPNHIGTGGAAVTTSDRAWATPFGTVEPDAVAVARLVRDGVAVSRPDVLTFEHSIGGLVPAVARLLPDARVVPLAVRRMPASEIRAVAGALAGLADEETLVVASVDFSHYRSAPEARGRNAESIRTMRALDLPALLEFGNEHMDSPSTIGLVMTAMRSRGATKFVLGADSDSAAITGVTAPPVTSYIVGYYVTSSGG